MVPSFPPCFLLALATRPASRVCCVDESLDIGWIHAHRHPVAAGIAVQHPALVEAGQARGHDVRVLDTLQFDIRVSRRNPELFYQGEPVGPVDAVIPRIGASITFFGLAVVRQFEMMGVYCLNESQAIARSRDKLRCLQLLSRHDIGLPPTVYTRQAEHVPGVHRARGGAAGRRQAAGRDAGHRRGAGRDRTRRPARSSRRSTGWTRTS